MTQLSHGPKLGDFPKLGFKLPFNMVYKDYMVTYGDYIGILRI